MGKYIPDAVIDLQLDPIQGSHIHVCSAQPANFAAIAGLELAGQVIAGAHTKADGDTSGRKSVTPSQVDVPIAASGMGDHVVESNGVDTIVSVTTCTPIALTAGGTVTIPAKDHEIADPQ